MTANDTIESAPSIDAVRALRDQLGSAIVRTPVLRCAAVEDALGAGTQAIGKLEFLQRTGTFKARGALAVVSKLDQAQLDAGITAVSAGNHAIAAAYAARTFGTNAKVVMIGTANAARIQACKDFGGEVVMAESAHAAFERAEHIQRTEGRFLVHPFEGRDVATGTGTVGLEICEQVDDFDAVIVAIGGGGLIGGLANAVKKLRPGCRVFGVEAEGADSMHRSFAAGEPMAIDKVATIADSLGAPYALPYSFALCRENVDELVTVSDQQIREAMGFLYTHMSIAVEPGCAASVAAVLGPLGQRLVGQKLVILFCGSNIDWQTWEAQAIVN